MRNPADRPPVVIRRVTASDLKIKTLLYGQPGAGKTTLALTANDHPALAPALVLNFEGGLLSVAGRGDVDAIDIESMEHLESILWLFAERNGEGHPDVADYKTVILDSGSELYNKALREVTEGNIRNRSNRNGTVDDVQLEDYGKAGNMVYRLFSAFRDLPRHLVVTSHAKFIYPPNANQAVNPNLEPIEVRPTFSGQLATRLMGIFDNVHFMYSYQVEEERDTGQVDQETGQLLKETVTVQGRAILTAPMGAYHAKTRGPLFADAMGGIVYNPTLPALYDLLITTEGNPDLERLAELRAEQTAREAPILEQRRIEAEEEEAAQDALTNIADATAALVRVAGVVLPDYLNTNDNPEEGDFDLTNVGAGGEDGQHEAEPTDNDNPLVRAEREELEALSVS